MSTAVDEPAPVVEDDEEVTPDKPPKKKVITKIQKKMSGMMTELEDAKAILLKCGFTFSSFNINPGWSTSSKPRPMFTFTVSAMNADPSQLQEDIFAANLSKLYKSVLSQVVHATSFDRMWKKYGYETKTITVSYKAGATKCKCKVNFGRIPGFNDVGDDVFEEDISNPNTDEQAAAEEDGGGGGDDEEEEDEEEGDDGGDNGPGLCGICLECCGMDSGSRKERKSFKKEKKRLEKEIKKLKDGPCGIYGVCFCFRDKETIRQKEGELQALMASHKAKRKLARVSALGSFMHNYTPMDTMVSKYIAPFFKELQAVSRVLASAGFGIGGITMSVGATFPSFFISIEKGSGSTLRSKISAASVSKISDKILSKVAWASDFIDGGFAKVGFATKGLVLKIKTKGMVPSATIKFNKINFSAASQGFAIKPDGEDDDGDEGDEEADDEDLNDGTEDDGGDLNADGESMTGMVSNIKEFYRVLSAGGFGITGFDFVLTSSPVFTVMASKGKADDLNEAIAGSTAGARTKNALTFISAGTNAFDKTLAAAAYSCNGVFISVKFDCKKGYLPGAPGLELNLASNIGMAR